MSVLPPGATVGIVGGGQLGRMTAMAAARLGFRTHIMCQSADEPAAQVAASTTLAAFDDEAALARFAESVDVATIEFENIPLATMEFLAERVTVRPRPQVLGVAQDRLAEKAFFIELGIGTAPFAPVTSIADLRDAVDRIGPSALLKTARMGYDGKGQLPVHADSDLEVVWSQLATDRAVLESFLELDCEISVIVARSADGSTACFDPARNEHRNNILHRTTVPTRVSPALVDQAVAASHDIVAALDLTGVLAIEYFVTGDGRLLANEMAPRPHNSGHWTIDACRVSQFEQLVRAVTGHPLGDTGRMADVEMLNLLGNDVERAAELIASPEVCLHLYGKAEARPGRKMGHVTRLLPLTREAV